MGALSQHRLGVPVPALLFVLGALLGGVEEVEGQILAIGEELASSLREVWPVFGRG